MKFNDDSLMLFDLDSCLDYGSYAADSDLSYSNQFVDFGCDDLEQYSNTIKSSLIDEIDLFANATTNETDFTAELCDFTDSLFNASSNNNNTNSSLNNSSSSFSNSSSYGTSSSNSTNSYTSHLTNDSKQCNAIEASSQDRRDVRKKLLDLTQRKLTNTLCYDNKLRNQVLLKSALKNVNSIDEDNLLGTKLDKQRPQICKFGTFDECNSQEQSDKLSKLINKYDKEDIYKDQDSLVFASTSPRKRNFKSNSSNLLNEKEMLDERNTSKKQKLCHILDDGEEYFLDENNFKSNYNDDQTLNNLANCFLIKLKTQHSHDCA